MFKSSNQNYSSTSATILKSFFGCSFVVGLLYILPDWIQGYAILGYSSFVYIFSTFMLLGAVGLFYGARSDNVNNAIEKHYDERIKSMDTNFIKKVSSPRNRLFVNSVVSINILMFAIFGGYVLNSELFKWSLILWSFSYLITVDYAESLVYNRYRDDLEEMSSKL